MEISCGDYLSQETSFLPSANIVRDRFKKFPKEKLLDLFLDCQERKDYRQHSEQWWKHYYELKQFYFRGASGNSNFLETMISLVKDL